MDEVLTSTEAPPRKPPWWRGDRGEWYVLVQLALMALVFFGPSTTSRLPEWPAAVASAATFVGAVMLFAGCGLLIAAAFRLGTKLTPLPYPKGGELAQTGAYRIVRHPMYTGGIAITVGWGLVVNGWLTLLYAIVLAVFLDVKASREERWLVAAYPGYPAYRQRVRKLIPFVR